MPGLKGAERLKHVREVLGAQHLKDSLAVKALLAAGVIAIVALMFPRGQSIEFRYSVGSIWMEEDFIPSFSFPIYKPDAKYRREVAAAADSVPPVFHRNVAAATELDSLRHFVSNVARVVSLQLRSRRWNIHPPATAEQRREAARDSTSTANETRLLGILFNESEWALLERLLAPGGHLRPDAVRSLDEFLVGCLSRAYARGILDVQKKKLTHTYLSLRQNTLEVPVPVDSFIDLDEAAALVEHECGDRFSKQVDLAALLAKIALEFVSPTVLEDPAATKQEIVIAQSRIPQTLGVVQAGERIIAKHDRVTPDAKLKIDSYLRASIERGGGQSTLVQWLGQALHVAAVLSLFGIYLFLFRKWIFHDNSRLLLISILILFVGAVAFVTLQINSTLPVEYLIVLPVASMLLAIIFDSRVAFYGTVVLSFLVAGIQGNNYTIGLASIVAGAFAVYTVRDIKDRTQIFRSLLFIFLGYTITIVAVGLEQYEPVSRIVVQIGFAGVNALVSPVLTFGFLIFFERAFRVTTDLTLLELSDFNHPLLRELSEKAPSTFHHAVIVGTLSEAAAEATHANAILARVGSYYHDIGKTLRPDYYVENQFTAKNVHDRLTPQMSALILTSHVKEGVELGQRYKLPSVILDFIPQHHGTTLISVFYDKALKQKGRKQEVRETDFRYPGPRPQTKEAGIVMLSDAIEATARSLDDPTPAHLERVIDETVKRRFMDGQLDECELTLRDLTKIREAFLRILLGIHHTRMKYPGQKEEETEAPPAEGEVQGSGIE